jgi:anti-sigma factor RsiW
MFSCQQVAERMTDWLDGRLGAVDALRFRFHLSICDACRQVLRQLQLTVDAIGELVGASPPQPTPQRVDEVLAVFRAWRTAEPPDG